MKSLTILGSTGSIGRTALRVVDQFPEKLRVFALTCGNNQDLLREQVTQYIPEVVVLGKGKPAKQLIEACAKHGTELLTGNEGILSISGAHNPDIVLAAMMGASGLEPTLEAVKAGKRIALANKEVMVMAGEYVSELAGDHQAEILPVDSEHNAIFQCLQGEDLNSVEKILLCASGGPFLDTPLESLENVSVAQALNHPRWSMGRKITIDSATMMNKGLEMIEAKWLFNLKPEQIDVVIHPQSIAHSMVEYVDGSIIAQMGKTDMFSPIQYTMSYPERWKNQSQRIDLHLMESLEFYEPNREKFKSLDLAETALRQGGSLPIVLNAADEIAVEAFLNEKISFSSIMDVVEATMMSVESCPVRGVDDILMVDEQARAVAVKKCVGLLNDTSI